MERSADYAGKVFDPTEVVEIPSSGAAVRDGAVIFLAVLCYPSDLRQRARFIEAWSAIARLSASRKLERWAERAYNRGAKLLVTRRIPAAEAAYSLQLNGTPLFGPLPQFDGLPWTIRSVHKGITKFASAREEDLITGKRASTEPLKHQDVNNFLPQVWSTSKPVIHLALALYRKLVELDPGSIDLMELVDKAANWLPSALRMAATDAELLPRAITGLTSGGMIQVWPQEADIVIDSLKPKYLSTHRAFVRDCLAAYENKNDRLVHQFVQSAQSWWLLRSARALRLDDEDPATQGHDREATDYFGPLIYAEINRRIEAGYPKTWAVSQFLM